MTPTPASASVEPRESSGSPIGRPLAIAAAVCVLVLLEGGGVGYFVGHHSGSSGSTAAFGGPPGAGGFGGGGGFQGGPGGGVAGQQRLQGTVTGTTSSTVTVKTWSGIATYTVTPTTEIIRNGRQASLSDVKSGDPVLVQVYSGSSGKLQVERLFAGTLPTGGPGFGGPPQGQGRPGGTMTLPSGPSSLN